MSAIEFAIVLPVLVVLLFGFIEFSILLYDKAMLTNASREGARAGIVYSDPNPIIDNDIRAVVNNYCANHLISFGTGSAVNTAISRTVESFGNALTVNVTYRYDFLVLPNFVTSLVGGVDLGAETVMRLENQG